MTMWRDRGAAGAICIEVAAVTYILEPLPLIGTIFAQGGRTGGTRGMEHECSVFVEIKPEMVWMCPRD